MGVRSLTRAAMIAAVAIGFTSAPASAQMVTFSTSGAFSGGSCGTSFCAFGGFILSWSGVTNGTGVVPNDVNLGQFQATCFWTQCSGGSILAGTTFMLTIAQTGPTSATGSISGSLGWDAATGTLSWTPNQGGVTVGGVNYNLDETGTGCAVSGTQCINIATSNTFLGQAFTNVTDDVTTTTPEPATLALTATGLLGLIPVARRRRRS